MAVGLCKFDVEFLKNGDSVVVNNTHILQFVVDCSEEDITLVTNFIGRQILIHKDDEFVKKLVDNEFYRFVDEFILQKNGVIFKFQEGMFGHFGYVVPYKRSGEDIGDGLYIIHEEL